MAGVNWIIWVMALQALLASLYVLQVLKRQRDAQKTAVAKPVPIK